MDFSWSPEDQEFYENVRKFAADNLNSGLSERRKNQQFNRVGWDACGEFGLLGLSASSENGGMGLGALRTARTIEAFGYGCEDAGLVFSSCAHLFACVMSLEHGGSERLKKELLPDLCQGKRIGANAATEAGAGSDFSSLQARFVKDGDDFLVTGEKHFVTNGPIADEILVYATSNPEQGFMGICGFLIATDTPGITVGMHTEKSGLSTSPWCTVYLDECRVPSWRRMIRPGGAVFIQSMEWERACLFAAWLGTMERQLERAVEHARERKQFGMPIGKNQAISHQLVDRRLALESSRLLLYRACWLMEQGHNATASICLSKLAVSEALVDSSLSDIQLRGASGVTIEGGVEHNLRDAVASRIYSGTNEMMREIVAREMGL